MFFREISSSFSRNSQQSAGKRSLPELPPRDHEECNQGKIVNSTVSADLGTSQQVFEPDISSSDSESDNDNLSEEVVSVSSVF